MSEGESKQAPESAQEAKPESVAAAPAAQGAPSSVSPPVSMVSQPPATAATEDEEEESEDESEILEESPCGRWQKRREEVGRVLCTGCTYVLMQITRFLTLHLILFDSDFVVAYPCRSKL